MKSGNTVPRRLVISAKRHIWGRALLVLCRPSVLCRVAEAADADGRRMGQLFAAIRRLTSESGEQPLSRRP